MTKEILDRKIRETEARVQYMRKSLLSEFLNMSSNQVDARKDAIRRELIELRILQTKRGNMK
jgi:hypothetical protein